MAINKLTVNGVEIPSVKSVTYKETVNSGVDLRPGCVSSAFIEAEVYGTQADAVAPGAEVSYYLVDADSNETLIGVFTAEPSIKTKNSYKFIAYDNANKLNVDFSAWLRDHQADFPMTRAALVAAACTIAGVTNATPNWTGSTQTVQAFYSDGLTCRDILSYAAELSGCYVHCHADGRIYFHWYSTVQNTRIYPSSGVDGSETRYAYKQDGLQYANYTVPAIDGVAVHPSGEDDVAYIYPASPAGDNLLHIRNNLLLTGAEASVYNAAAQRIYNQMTAVGAYVPATAQMFISECPYSSGDIALVTDIQGVSFKTIVMSKTVTSSGVVLESTGNETQESGYENTQKALTQLASDVVQINKLKVGYAEIAQAIIDVLIANDITAQNLTIVDEHGNVLATYDADGITLGETDKTHAEIDFNSLVVYDANGDAYVHLGDERDASGYADIVKLFAGDGTTTVFSFQPPAYSTGSIVVKVNGTIQTSGITKDLRSVTFATAPANGASIEIDYKTRSAAYRYDLGRRASGYSIGVWSVACGCDSVASDSYSAVSGGYNNKATGFASAIGGGQGNTADGTCSTVCGGQNNTASDLSVVCGGAGNSAERYGAVLSGHDNTSTGGTVLAGSYNESGGSGAVASGYHIKTPSANQFAFGKYNDLTTAPSTYVEYVGNGTSDTVRSNARTLDWSGNEWLAGQINADTGNFRNGASSSGNVEITGGWFVRRLPAAISTGTEYRGLRFTESNGTTGRGSVQFYRSSTNGDGIRIASSQQVNGSAVSNILGLYVDDSGNRSIGVSEVNPWLKALGLAYFPGDSFTLSSTSYTPLAGEMRTDKIFYFTIPLTKQVASSVSTISISGSILMIGVNTSAKYKSVVLNDPSSAPLDACNATVQSNAAGLAVRCEFAVSQSSWWTTQTPIAVQANGITISFS